MKPNLSKQGALAKIDALFKKDSFSKDEVRKIKNLAMKYRIRLGEHRKKFCSSCLSQLKGELKLTKTHKTIICQVCNCKNKFKF